jgi:hypothetical protein
MWQEEFVMETNSKKENIWALWTDVKNWNKWDASVEYSYLNGIFQNGTNGSFKSSNKQKPFYVFYKLINCIPEKSFTRRTKLFLCTMDVGHELIDEDNKLKIKSYIRIHGPLTFFYKDGVGKDMWKKLPKSAKKAAELAEKSLKNIKNKKI